jgi:hypothetical protein
MQIPLIEIDDRTAERLLAAFDANAADFEDEGRRALALSLIVNHLLGTLDVAAGAITGPSREEVERELLALAAAPVAYEASLDTRGEAAGVWTPETDWRTLETAPARWTELETALRTIYDLLATHPELRTVATARITPTNEEQTEVVLAAPEAPITVESKIGGVRHRFVIDPKGAIVIGVPAEEPRPIRER